MFLRKFAFINNRHKRLTKINSTKMLCRCKVVKKEYREHTCMSLDRPEKPIHTYTLLLLLLLTLAKCMVYNISSHHILWLLLLKQQVHKIFLSAFVIFLHHMHNGSSLIFLYTWLGMCTNGIWYKLEFYHHHVLSIWK